MDFRPRASLVAGEQKGLSGKTGAICDEIEARLLRGYYRFGQELLVNDLVKEFGASRAPVMAALNYLRTEGYLVITPQVGCRVISPHLSDIEDFVTVFSRVEAVIAGMAAKRRYADEVERLSMTQQAIKRVAPKKAQPVTQAYVDLITDFHRQIHIMSHSAYAGERATRNWKLLDFFLFNGSFGEIRGGEYLAIADKQRAEIVDAIARHDSAAADALMEKHMCDKAKWFPVAPNPAGADVAPQGVADGERVSGHAAEKSARRRRR